MEEERQQKQKAFEERQRKAQEERLKKEKAEEAFKKWKQQAKWKAKPCTGSFYEGGWCLQMLPVGRSTSLCLQASLFSYTVLLCTGLL